MENGFCFGFTGADVLHAVLWMARQQFSRALCGAQFGTRTAVGQPTRLAQSCKRPRLQNLPGESPGGLWQARSPAPLRSGACGELRPATRWRPIGFAPARLTTATNTRAALTRLSAKAEAHLRGCAGAAPAVSAAAVPRSNSFCKSLFASRNALLSTGSFCT